MRLLSLAVKEYAPLMKTNIPETARAYLSELGKRGGRARAEKLTAKELKEISKKGNDTRWASVRKAKKEAK